MNYNKKTVRDIDVSGKKVLLRCDFNVPQDKETGEITSDKRIVAALPTIRYLLEAGAAVIACSHLGKPKNGPDPKLSLAPVAKRLSELLGKEVIFAADVVGEDARAKAAALQPGQILLLENTRFEKGETKNDPELARALAAMADVYVSDAFGAVHRAHASTAGVADYLPAVSGFLIQKELDFLGGAIANPKRPLVAILGGSKVSSKIGVINNLLEIADTIIIGGGMAYTFSAAQGGKIGDSLLEEDWKGYALEMIDKAKAKGVKSHALMLKHALRNALIPMDASASTEGERRISPGKSTPAEAMPEMARIAQLSASNALISVIRNRFPLSRFSLLMVMSISFLLILFLRLKVLQDALIQTSAEKIGAQGSGFHPGSSCPG